MTPTVRPAWHRPVARALAQWQHGGWRTRLARLAHPALARALDVALDALPPDISAADDLRAIRPVVAAYVGDGRGGGGFANFIGPPR